MFSRAILPEKWGAPGLRRGHAFRDHALVRRIRNSLHPGATRWANFGFKSCTSKLVFLVWFSNLKFLPRACHQSDRNFKFTTLGPPLIARVCRLSKRARAVVAHPSPVYVRRCPSRSDWADEGGSARHHPHPSTRCGDTFSGSLAGEGKCATAAPRFCCRRMSERRSRDRAKPGERPRL